MFQAIPQDKLTPEVDRASPVAFEPWHDELEEAVDQHNVYHQEHREAAVGIPSENIAATHDDGPVTAPSLEPPTRLNAQQHENHTAATGKVSCSTITSQDTNPGQALSPAPAPLTPFQLGLLAKMAHELRRNPSEFSPIHSTEN